MKKTLITLALSAAALSNVVYANTGTINFEGQVTSGTCSIDIIDPGTGKEFAGTVPMGSVASSYFKQPGTEGKSRAFALRVKPGAGCDTSATNQGSVAFTGAYGAAGSGELHALHAGGATGGLLLSPLPINPPSPADTSYIPRPLP